MLQRQCFSAASFLMFERKVEGQWIVSPPVLHRPVGVGSLDWIAQNHNQAHRRVVVPDPLCCWIPVEADRRRFSPELIGFSSLEVAMQLIQVWLWPGLLLVIEKVQLFLFGQVNSGVLAQIGGKSRRAAFLGTAYKEAQPFAHDQASAGRTVSLLVAPLSVVLSWRSSVRCLSPVVTAPAHPYWLL